MLTFEEYYGDDLPRLKYIEQKLIKLINQYPVQETIGGIQPIIYSKTRIKKPESMIRKLELQGFDTDSKTALVQMHDAVGLRVVCSFIDDVYDIANWISNRVDFKLVQTKDYIKNPKQNGYRSLHLIIKFDEEIMNGIMAEIQLRTIAIDSWAALEHQLKYKKNISHEKTIQQELKLCADEIASVDMSMQTLRDLLLNSEWQ